MNLRSILRFGILGALLITPFLSNYVSSDLYFPFITGKNFTFRILVEVATALWAILLLVDKEVRPKFSWLFAGASAFTGIILVADVFGVDPHRSLWSGYERMEGFVSIAHLYLYFLVLGSFFDQEKFWSWMAHTWLGASIFIIYGALGQIYGTNGYNYGGGRVDAGLGNAAYMGIYAALNVFLAILLWVKNREHEWWKYFYLVFGLLNTYLVFKSQTRGSILGLVGGLVLGVLLYAVFQKKHPLLRKYLFAALGVFVVLSALFFVNRNATWIDQYPSLKRIAAISPEEGTGKIRLWVWGISLEGFKERPILGWGQDNFIHTFAKHYDPRMWTAEPWYDRSHNVFFDWLIAGGILGLLSYLSLYAASLYYLWIHKGGSEFSLEEKSVVTGLIAAYFIHNLFVFDNLISYMFFFALIAWVHSRVTQGEDTSSGKKTKKGNDDLSGGDMAIVIALVLAILGVMVYFVNIRDISANRTLLTALRGDGAVYMDGEKQKIRVLDALDQATIGRGEIREQVVLQAVQVSRMESATKQTKEQFAIAADKIITETLADTPNDLRMISSALMFYSSIGANAKADEYFNKAITISPKRGMLYLDYLSTKLMQGDAAGAVSLGEKAVSLMPGNTKADIGYAAALIASGKTNDAKQILVKYKGKADILDERLMFALTSVKANTEIIEVIESMKDTGLLKSRDYIYYQDALVKVGRKADAIVALRRAAELDPSIAKQVEDYIGKMK